MLRYPLDKFIRTTPEWNDNKFVVDESFYEVDMDKLLKEVN